MAASRYNQFVNLDSLQNTMPNQSLGKQIVRGLLAGCIVLMFTDFLFYVSFHFGVSSLAFGKMWEALGGVLLLCGFVLLLASLIMSFFNRKLAVLGMIVGVLAILAGISAPVFISV